MEGFVISDLMKQMFSAKVYTGIVNGMGDRKYKDDLALFKGYYVGKSELVYNVYGEQVLSSAQIFVKAKDLSFLTPGSLVTSNVLPLNAVPIIAIQSYYTSGGKLSYGVVFLT